MSKSVVTRATESAVYQDVSEEHETRTEPNRIYGTPVAREGHASIRAPIFHRSDYKVCYGIGVLSALKYASVSFSSVLFDSHSDNVPRENRTSAS